MAIIALALSNPLLFVLLVNKAEQDGTDKDVFTALVLEKRDKILDYLGLPASKSVLRLLARTQYSNANSNDLDAVLEVLSRPIQLTRIRHVKQLSLNHILFLQQFQGMFWPGVLEIITPETNSAFAYYVCRMASDCCALGISAHGEGWRVNEVRGHSNTMPTEESLQHIHDWFKAVTEKKKPVL